MRRGSCSSSRRPGPCSNARRPQTLDPPSPRRHLRATCRRDIVISENHQIGPKTANRAWRGRSISSKWEGLERRGAARGRLPRTASKASPRKFLELVLQEEPPEGLHGFRKVNKPAAAQRVRAHDAPQTWAGHRWACYAMWPAPVVVELGRIRLNAGAGEPRLKTGTNIRLPARPETTPGTWWVQRQSSFARGGASSGRRPSSASACSKSSAPAEPPP